MLKIRHLLILLILSNCSKEFNETALLLPPNFHKLPIISQNTSPNKDIKSIKDQKIKTEDLQDLKKLLLE